MQTHPSVLTSTLRLCSHDLHCLLQSQPVVSSAVDFFFGRVDARVPPGTTFHERLADLMLTSFTFSAEDPGRSSCLLPR